MGDVPEGYVAHRSDVRLRLRFPSRRRDGPFFARIGDQLAAMPGVDGVDANPFTGSILVRTADAALVIQRAEREGLFRVAERKADGERKLFRQRGGRRTGRFSDGIGVRHLIGAGLAGAGVVQIARGNIFAPAVTMLWCAGDIFQMWRRPAGRPPDTDQAPTIASPRPLATE